jgi:hypothetical protein
LLECFRKWSLFWSCQDKVPTNQMYKRISASGQAECLIVWLGCPLGDSMRMCVYVFTGLLLVSLAWQWSSVCELSLSFGLATSCDTEQAGSFGLWFLGLVSFFVNMWYFCIQVYSSTVAYVQCLLECFKRWSLFWSCQEVPTNQMYNKSGASGQAKYLHTVANVSGLNAGVYVFIGLHARPLPWHLFCICSVSYLWILDLQRVVVPNNHGVRWCDFGAWFHPCAHLRLVHLVQQKAPWRMCNVC